MPDGIFDEPRMAAIYDALDPDAMRPIGPVASSCSLPVPARWLAEPAD